MYYTVHVLFTAILAKVNNLLSQLHVEKPVSSIADIGAGVFVTLFEGLCGEQLTGMCVHNHLWINSDGIVT